VRLALLCRIILTARDGRGQVRRSAVSRPFYISPGTGASFGAEQEFGGEGDFPENSGGQFEEFVDEPILTPDSTPAQPPPLALPNYVVWSKYFVGRVPTPKTPI